VHCSTCSPRPIGTNPPDIPAAGSSARDTVGVRIDCAAYVDGLRRDFDPDTMTIDDPVVGDGFVWLGLRMPDEAELGRGMEALQITGVAAADVLRPHARPVLTVDGSIVQLVLRTVAYDDRDETIALGEMTLLVGRRAVITVRHGQASQLSSARAALEADPDRLRLGPLRSSRPWSTSSSTATPRRSTGSRTT
jgi:magnesium transporter